MQTFQELAASRRQWIDDILVPWCRQASRRELREAEMDWMNVAGRVDPAMTLWIWAWSRFPALTHENVGSLDETKEVQVTLRSGESVIGFPDARESENGLLVLLGKADGGDFEHLGPFSIDDVQAVELHGDAPQTESSNPPPRPVTTLDPYSPDDQRV